MINILKLSLTAVICTNLSFAVSQIKLPEPKPIPYIPAPAEVGSVLMGDPAAFDEVKMDFPIYNGPFEPEWESIDKNYNAYPSWLREAKFGIWVHFGPQASGMSGDWYARRMYLQGQKAYENHLKDFGHPSKEGFGYKDILNKWNPDKYNPARLAALYKKSGAGFLFIQGVHHDNYDLWDSKYQPWNSVNIGPKRDFLEEWSKAARKEGLYYGITFHHEYTWWWWESAFRSDTSGLYKGLPYDGNQTIEDGKGKWWEGYDPRMLYGINLREYKGVDSYPNTPPKGIFTRHLEYANWYAENWALRIMDAVEKYNPDFIYTDGNDTQPFSGFKTGSGYKSNAGQRVIASYFNKSLSEKGKVDVFSIIKFHRAGHKGVVSTYEGSYPKDIVNNQTWIGENPLGDWYYAPDFVYSSDAVIRFLLECISRDGCYAVNIPISPDGSLVPECEKMLLEIGDWMKINSKAIYGSKAWIKYGEGNKLLPKGKLDKRQAEFKFDKEDFRFTLGKDGNLYAFCMLIPSKGDKLCIKSLSNNSSEKVKSIKLLGSKKKVNWEQNINGLELIYPETAKLKTAACFQIVLSDK